MTFSNTRATEIILEGHFSEYLALPGVTDVCYNGGNIVYCLSDDGWEEKETTMNFEDAISLAESVASARDQVINKEIPMLSADLPDGERVQFNIPPSTDRGVCVIAIRIPSKKKFTIEDYEKSGMFKKIEKSDKSVSQVEKRLITLYKEKNFGEFLKEATIAKQTIVFAGRTGSGKTTFAKTLINYIPKDERLISIEDTKEIDFSSHPNSVNLYYPSHASPKDPLNASTLLYASLRLIGSRILLTEMRDPAAYYNFIEAVKSGHSGSITSMHAGNVNEAFSKLIGMYLSYDAAKGMPHSLIENEIKDLIDIVVCLDRDEDSGQRFINDIYFKKVDYEKK